MAGTLRGAPPTSGELQSQVAEAPTTPANLPSIAPEADFIYYVNPARWELHEYTDGTQEFLPVLSKLRLDPGVGGVSETGNPRLAKAARLDKGLIEIPRMHGPEDYVQKIQVRAGWLYHERWRKFVRDGSQIKERHTPQDHDDFLHWLHDVCAGKWPALPSGVPAPLPETIEGRQEMYRAKLTRQIEAAAGNPLKATSVEHTQARIDALEEVKTNLESGSTVIPPKPGKPTLAQKLKGTLSKRQAAKPPEDVPDAEG